jgi:hypothetical protein
MKPERRPSKPGRSSFFSRLAFFLSALAVTRACRLSFRLRYERKIAEQSRDMTVMLQTVASRRSLQPAVEDLVSKGSNVGVTRGQQPAADALLPRAVM